MSKASYAFVFCIPICLFLVLLPWRRRHGPDRRGHIEEEGGRFPHVSLVSHAPRLGGPGSLSAGVGRQWCHGGSVTKHAKRPSYVLNSPRRDAPGGDHILGSRGGGRGARATMKTQREGSLLLEKLTAPSLSLIRQNSTGTGFPWGNEA